MMNKRELELFAKWLQEKEYLVRRSSSEVVSEYTSNSQPNGGERVVNENEPQKEVCICGFPHTQVRSDNIRYCIGCGKPKQTD